MAQRGPVPKRSTQRRRANKPKTPTTKSAAAKKVTVPAADPKWHPAAKKLYASAKISGQSAFYEPSDWHLLWLTCESISRDLKPQVVGIDENSGKPVFAVVPLKGASLAAYLKASAVLMLTEGDRRRAGIELERGASDDGAVSAGDVPSLDEYRARFAG